jgi:hypothetical protein
MSDRLRAAFSFTKPMALDAVCERAGLPHTARSDRVIVHRYIQHLEDRGHIKRVGTRLRQWMAHGGLSKHQVLTWVRTTPPALPREARSRGVLVRQLVSRVERLEQRRQVSQGLTQRMATAARPLSARNQAIVERRLKGETLISIAADFGVTRERARQIVELATKAGPVRPLGRAN